MPRLLQLLQIMLQEYLTSGVGIPSLMLYKFIWTIIIHETWSPKNSKRSQSVKFECNVLQKKEDIDTVKNVKT